MDNVAVDSANEAVIRFLFLLKDLFCHKFLLFIILVAL